MERIKLNELEYPAKEFMQSGENLSFIVCDISNYAEFRSVLTKENLHEIKIYSEGGVLSTVFEGYIDLTGKFDIKENEDGTMDVTVYLQKPDPIMQELAELKAKIVELETAK